MKKLVKLSKFTTNVSAAGNEQFQSITANLFPSVRKETLEGREYEVAPMVMIVEGVLNGSNGALFYPSDELEKIPQVWNHKPIVVYHPVKNNVPVSACDPDIIEKYKVGMILNTSFDGKRLKGEAWLEVERVKVVDNRVQEALDAGKMMELSTGLWTENEETPGTFAGKAYTHIARNFRPDHLAILPDQLGACSIKDGAGLLRTNSLNSPKVLQLMEHLNVNSDVSHDEVRRALYTALRPTSIVESSMVDDIWIESVYDDFFIYTKGSKYLKQFYTMSGEKAELAGDAVEVHRKTVYELVQKTTTNKKGDTHMNKEKMVLALIASNQTKWEEKDKAVLLAMNEDVLAKMLPTENSATDKGKEIPTPEVPTATPKGPVTESTINSFMQTVPEELRETLTEAMATQNEQKTTLISTIVAAPGNSFTQEQLSKFNMNSLKSIAALIAKPEAPKEGDVHYIGNGIGQNASTAGSKSVEEPLELPTFNFKAKA